MLRPILALILSAFLVGSIPAAENKSTALFNGRDFAGWEFVTSPATDITTVCKVESTGVIAAAGKPVGYLATTATHKNYRLHAEWRWTDKAGNSGVLIHIVGGPKDRQWPVCFQVQMKNKSVGDLIPMAGAKFAEPFTTPPDANPALRTHSAPDSEKPLHEWNTCDVTCRGDTIEVTINGVLQNRVSGCSAREGKIGFQFEGVPFELRNVRLDTL